MPPLKDLTGQKFGNLTVIERASNRNNRIYWKCQCDCGNVLEIRGDSLKRGATKSCGYCGPHPAKLLDIIGKRFGKLTVLEKCEEKDSQKQVLYKCRCDCGKIIVARGTSLRYGSTQSCGSPECKGVKNNLIGQKFGKLTVIEESDYRNSYNNNAYWLCKCECGNSVVVNGSYLTTGMTKSCGCLTSKGELKINELLSSNTINYVSQKKFDSCRFMDSGKMARFDFYIIDLNYLIEFDGIQHFEYKNSGWDTKEKFQKTQEHDAYKNQWCKDNNIPLIRIPYTKLDTLCIEDLMLETTQFRVV